MLGISNVLKESSTNQTEWACWGGLTSLVSQTSAPSVYMTSSFWLPFPGAKRIFFTQPRCVGIPLKTSASLVTLGRFCPADSTIAQTISQDKRTFDRVELLPGQTGFQVPEVQIAVHVPEHQGVTFPGNAGDAAHTALQHRRGGGQTLSERRSRTSARLSSSD